MDSIKAMKGGYGKVNQNIENQTPTKKPKTTRTKLIIIPTIILTTLILCILTTLLLHSTTPKSNLNSISLLCNLTTHPKSCTSTLQNSTSSDPETLFHLSLQSTLNKFSNLSSLPRRLMVKVNDPRVKSALVDCESLVGDSADEVKSSVEAMSVGKGEKMLTVGKIGDIKTWLSAALTNLETCLDGLEEVGGGVKEEMEIGMKECKEYTGNCLAIVNKIESVLDQLHIQMH